jgi:hypothetical protein
MKASRGEEGEGFLEDESAKVDTSVWGASTPRSSKGVDNTGSPGGVVVGIVVEITNSCSVSMGLISLAVDVAEML